MFKKRAEGPVLVFPPKTALDTHSFGGSAISRKMGSAELLTGKSSAMNNRKSVLGVNFFRDPLHLRVQP